MVSYRYWFGTCKWDEDDDIEKWQTVFHYNEKMDFLIGQLEQGEKTGYKHWQVVFHVKDKIGLITAKKLFEIGGFKHWNCFEWEKSNGKAANEYVQKDDTCLGERFSFGSLPMKMNSKTDWAHQLELAIAGRANEMEPGILLRNYSNIKKIRTDVLKAEERVFIRKEHAKWYWGAPGTGKSLRASREFKDVEGGVYWKSGHDKWFEGYEGEGHVIIDDIGIDCIRISRMLSWVNWTPYRVDVKGSSTPLFASRWIVTSNMHPRDIWTDPKDAANLEALMDRFEIIEIIKPF